MLEKIWYLSKLIWFRVWFTPNANHVNGGIAEETDLVKNKSGIAAAQVSSRFCVFQNPIWAHVRPPVRAALGYVHPHAG